MTYSVASILLTIGVVSYACANAHSVLSDCDLFMYFEVFGSGFVQPGHMSNNDHIQNGNVNIPRKTQDAEYEVLSENARYAFTETCLALTYFRDELNLKVAGLFVALLVSKIFHWLCKERITYMESTQNTPFEAHSLDFFKATLLSVDTAFVSVALHSIQTHGPSVWLLFGF